MRSKTIKELRQEEINALESRLKNLKKEKATVFERILESSAPIDLPKDVDVLHVPVVIEKVIEIEKKRKRNSFLEFKNLPKGYKEYAIRAKTKGLPFEITIEEFYKMTSGNCVYCGHAGGNGIDRLDSKKGYVKANIVPCCWPCNRMKYTASEADFLNHVKRIYEFMKLNKQQRCLPLN